MFVKSRNIKENDINSPFLPLLLYISGIMESFTLEKTHNIVNFNHHLTLKNMLKSTAKPGP